MRKITAAFFMAVIVIVLVCVNLNSAFAESFKSKLLALDSVVSVDEIVQSGDSKPFAEKYIVTFKQPLDWDNPDGASFTQRVEIGLSENPETAVNIFYVSGYELYDEILTIDDRMDLAKNEYPGNYIVPEYRFFYKSAPDGLDVNSTELWDYLNDRQASNDFHKIITQLKKLLKGKCAFTGISKGGQAAYVYAYYFPDDMDAYVHYVGPFCEGLNDQRMPEAVNTVIGDSKYGAEKAAEYRKLLLDYQVELLRHRTDFIDMYSFDVTSENARLRPEYTPDILFEMSVLDLTYGIWQYHQNFAPIQDLMNMPHGDDATADENKNFTAELTNLFQRHIRNEPGVPGNNFNRINGILQLLRGNNNSQSGGEDDNVNTADDNSAESDIIVDTLLYPYFVQAARENGNYAYNFKYLREAVNNLNNSEVYLVVSEDVEGEINSWTFTQEQREKFKFDDTLLNQIKSWVKTTEAPIIMLFAESDPWYYGRLNINESEFSRSIHFYSDSAQSHAFKIGKMSNDVYIQEVRNLLDKLLIGAANVDLNTSSLSSSKVSKILQDELGLDDLPLVISEFNIGEGQKTGELFNNIRTDLALKNMSLAGVMPNISVDVSGFYIVNIALDKSISQDLPLHWYANQTQFKSSGLDLNASANISDTYYIFLNDSCERINKIPADRSVNVAVYLEAGTEYEPFITVSNSNSTSSSSNKSSSGCNSGIFSVIGLSGLILISFLNRKNQK